MFSCEFCKISKNTFSYRKPLKLFYYLFKTSTNFITIKTRQVNNEHLYNFPDFIRILFPQFYSTSLLKLLHVMREMLHVPAENQIIKFTDFTFKVEKTLKLSGGWTFEECWKSTDYLHPRQEDKNASRISKMLMDLLTSAKTYWATKKLLLFHLFLSEWVIETL